MIDNSGLVPLVRFQIESGAIRADIAETYARGLMAPDGVDFDLLDQLIIERWSPDALKQIKRWAWKIYERYDRYSIKNWPPSRQRA